MITKTLFNNSALQWNEFVWKGWKKIIMSKTGIIYVISNPAMPDMVNIGKTERDLKARIRELSSPSGVPLAFECVVAKRVKDMDFAETKLHETFASKRINANEFFNIEQDELLLFLNSWTENMSHCPRADI